MNESQPSPLEETTTKQIIYRFTHSGKLFLDTETWKVRFHLL